MRVLVVDASRAMRQIVVRTLRQAGFAGLEVVEAADGRSALGVWESGAPDVVLSGWNLPGLDGLGLLRVLRGRGDDVPFGFVTSERSWVSRERAAAAGAAFLLSKPFTVEAFAEVVGPVLSRDRVPGGLACSGVVPGAAADSRGDRPDVPSRMAVRDMLTALLGRTVTVGDGVPVVPNVGALVGVVSVVDDDGDVMGVVVADLVLCAAVGSALGLVPPGEAREMAASGVLSAAVVENVGEVLRVCASSFNGVGVRPVRAGGFWFDTAVVPVPFEVALATREFGARSDLVVRVQGYPEGGLSLVTVRG